jgi:hypothetical protein
MDRTAKFKVAAARLPPRKSATAAVRRGFPAWIDAGEQGGAFAAKKKVMPRVRDGLVLRTVGRAKKTAAPRRNAHGSGAR